MKDNVENKISRKLSDLGNSAMKEEVLKDIFGDKRNKENMLHFSSFTLHLPSLLFTIFLYFKYAITTANPSSMQAVYYIWT